MSSHGPIRIVGICGSLRQGGYTRLALEVALRGAGEVGAHTQLLDLREYALPLCHGGEESAYPEGVARLRAVVQAAKGIILGTPVYHGSYSGVLKNALDLMGFREFEGKMVGLVGVSGGRAGAVSAFDSLRAVGRTLHAWVIPEQASIPQAWQAFDRTGQLKDAELEERVMEVGRQVARFAYLHSSAQAREFLELWERAPQNPGAEDR